MTTTESGNTVDPALASPVSKATDVLLASFPRSGTSWMINILLRAGLLTLQPEAYRASVVNPHQLKEYAGLYAAGVEALQVRWEKSQLRILKTHDLPRIWGRQAIYIHRDGRDVVTSYFFYLKSHSQIPESTTFSEFLWKDRSLRSSWTSPVGAADYLGRGPAGLCAQHVCFWRAARAFKPLHMLRYEQLLRQPLQTLRPLFEFLRVQRSDEQLQQVIEETQFEKLRETERAADEKDRDASLRFFRAGKSGNWREHFSPEDIEPFKEQAGQTLIELGYEDDLRWDLERCSG